MASREGWEGPFQDVNGDRYYHNRETGDSEWAEDVEVSNKTPPPGTPMTLSAFKTKQSLDHHRQVLQEHGVGQNESLSKLNDALKEVFSEQTSSYIGEITTLQDQLEDTTTALAQKSDDYDRLVSDVQNFREQQEIIEKRCADYESQISDLQKGLQQAEVMLHTSENSNDDLRNRIGTLETQMPHTPGDVGRQEEERRQMEKEDEHSRAAAAFETKVKRGVVRSFEYGNKQIYSAMSEFQIDVVPPTDYTMGVVSNMHCVRHQTCVLTPM